MLKIGEFSKLSRISIRMLRHYDEIGLLTPEETDPFTGYRYYSAYQRFEAGRITALKEMGFKLCDVAELLRRWNVKTIPKRQVASVRQIISSYEREGDLWGLMMKETAHMRIQSGDPCLCCAVFHDKDYKEIDVDVEVYKTVQGAYPDTEHVTFKTMPAVQVAPAVCKGSYDKIGEVNAAVASWVEANGYAFDGPMFNIYCVSPHETQDLGEFVTEVCYPVRKK